MELDRCEASAYTGSPLEKYDEKVDRSPIGPTVELESSGNFIVAWNIPFGLLPCKHLPWTRGHKYLSPPASNRKVYTLQCRSFCVQRFALLRAQLHLNEAY